MRPPLNGFREPATGKRVIRSHCSRFSIDPCFHAVIFGLLLITLFPRIHLYSRCLTRPSSVVAGGVPARVMLGCYGDLRMVYRSGQGLDGLDVVWSGV